MKDRIMNVLMLITVGAALILSLNGAPSAQDRPALSQVFISSSDVPLPTPRPIDSFRTQREEDRRQSIQALTRIQENPEMAAALRSLAGEQLLQLLRCQETECALEAALIAKGYENALCIVDKERLTVFAAAPLQPEDMALIAHLAQEIAGILPENIRISPC